MTKDDLKRLDTIRRALKRRGGGSWIQVAQFIGVDDVTVWRWRRAGASPRPAVRRALALGARIAANDLAREHLVIRNGLFSGLMEQVDADPAHNGLLQIGLEGVLRQMGCGWLVDDGEIL